MKNLRDLERELMLIGRHSVMTVPGRGALLERSAYILLSRLETEGPMSIGQLADAFGLDTSTVHRQTSAMLRADLARRIPDPDGGLARKLSITREGARRLADDRAHFQAGLGVVLDDWPEEEVARFVELLIRFNHSIEQRENRPWPRPALTPGD